MFNNQKEVIIPFSLRENKLYFLRYIYFSLFFCDAQGSNKSEVLYEGCTETCVVVQGQEDRTIWRLPRVPKLGHPPPLKPLGTSHTALFDIEECFRGNLDLFFITNKNPPLYPITPLLYPIIIKNPHYYL